MPIAIITGGHAGLGLECSRRLAFHHGFDLVLAGRSASVMNDAASELRRSGSRIATLELDVASIGSVRAAAASCRGLLDTDGGLVLGAMLCNAGAQFAGPASWSEDGYERTFATNYLGHFLLVQLLLDRMADDGRIVFTASGTHDPATMDGRMVGRAVAPDAVALAHAGRDGARPLPAGVRYATAKLCEIMLAYELDRRLRRAGSGIAAIAFDPGSIPETGLLRTMPLPVRWLARTRTMKAAMRRMGVTQGSLDFSGAALARLAADPEHDRASGCYLQSDDGKLVERRSSDASYDATDAERLWLDSERLVELTPQERPMLLESRRPR